MGRGGRVDLRQLKAFERKLAKLATADYDKFCQDCAKELAARLLAKVIKRTPIGVYKDGTVGGTLRRGWTAKSHREAELAATFGGGNEPKKFTDSMTVRKVGSNYEIEVINPVEYAWYVEYGHRTRNHKGWVSGKFMMTISADELENQSPAILEKKLFKFLKGAFDGD